LFDEFEDFLYTEHLETNALHRHGRQQHDHQRALGLDDGASTELSICDASPSASCWPAAGSGTSSVDRNMTPPSRRASRRSEIAAADKNGASVVFARTWRTRCNQTTWTKDLSCRSNMAHTVSKIPNRVSLHDELQIAFIHSLFVFGA
jgi:hypothetical protein